MALQVERGYTVLCAANSYVHKFYLNPAYENLPKDVKTKLKLISVDFTEGSGGILLMEFSPAGKLVLKTVSDEKNIFLDESKSDQKIHEITEENRELFAKLELYFRAMQTIRAGQAAVGAVGTSVAGQEGEPGARNPEGHAEVLHASDTGASGNGEGSEDDTDIAGADEAEPTGEWDMPVSPDDDDAENTAYHILFGE